jgi:hypothetical protein
MTGDHKLEKKYGKIGRGLFLINVAASAKWVCCGLRLTQCATSVKLLDRRNLIEIVQDVLAVELADGRLDVLGFIRCNGTEHSGIFQLQARFGMRALTALRSCSLTSYMQNRRSLGAIYLNTDRPTPVLKRVGNCVQLG